MASPALEEFGADIDSLSLNQEAKDGLKQRAETFYIDAIKEAVDHVERHLDAAIVDNPGNSELRVRAELIRSWLVKVRLDDINLPLAIHEGLET